MEDSIIPGRQTVMENFSTKTTQQQGPNTCSVGVLVPKTNVTRAWTELALDMSCLHTYIILIIVLNATSDMNPIRFLSWRLVWFVVGSCYDSWNDSGYDSWCRSCCDSFVISLDNFTLKGPLYGFFSNKCLLAQIQNPWLGPQDCRLTDRTPVL